MADPAELVLLRRARDTVDRAYAEPLDVPALARVAHMSVGHFARRFRDEFGETPYAYLMTRRIERAMALLRRGDLSVAEVCMEVGATSIGSFSARFAEVVGCRRVRTAASTTRRALAYPPASPNGPTGHDAAESVSFGDAGAAHPP